MQKSINRGSMFGEIERRESLNVANDGFGHVAGVEQHFIVIDNGKDFIFLRTRVKRAKPRRKSWSARFLPI